MGQTYPPEYTDICKEVDDQLTELIGTDSKMIAEEYFAHHLGYGGRCDLHSKQGAGIVVDYKTKEKFPRDAKGRISNMGYDSHVMQLKAYAVGLGVPHARLFNVFIEWSGEVVIKEWSVDEADHAWEQFKATLALWKIIKGYDSSYAIN